MFGLGIGELLVIFIFALVFIGPKKLPELAKSLGKGLREFQNATKGFSEQLDQAKREITSSIDPGLRPEDFEMHPHTDNAPSDKPAQTVVDGIAVVPQQDTKPKEPV